MDVLWGYYAKWDMAGREKQIRYDITYTWNIENETN